MRLSPLEALRMSFTDMSAYTGIRVQDSWAVREGMGGSDQVLFGVFDGHGAEGRTVSGAVADLLPQIVEAALSDAAAASSQTKVQYSRLLQPSAFTGRSYRQWRL